MKSVFKEIHVEIYRNNLDKHNVRIDNILNGQYINILTTSNEDQALSLYGDLCILMDKYKES